MRHQQHTSMRSQQLFVQLLSHSQQAFRHHGTAPCAVQREMTNANPTLLRVALCTATRVACNAGRLIQQGTDLTRP